MIIVKRTWWSNVLQNWTAAVKFVVGVLTIQKGVYHCFYRYITITTETEEETVNLRLIDEKKKEIIYIYIYRFGDEEDEWWMNFLLFFDKHVCSSCNTCKILLYVLNCLIHCVESNSWRYVHHIHHNNSK